MKYLQLFRRSLSELPLHREKKPRPLTLQRNENYLKKMIALSLGISIFCSSIWLLLLSKWFFEISLQKSTIFCLHLRIKGVLFVFGFCFVLPVSWGAFWKRMLTRPKKFLHPPLRRLTSWIANYIIKTLCHIWSSWKGRRICEGFVIWGSEDKVSRELFPSQHLDTCMKKVTAEFTTQILRGP